MMLPPSIEVCSTSIESNVFITLCISSQATPVDGEESIIAKKRKCKLPAWLGLFEPRFIRLPSDKEKQAAYWNLEAKFTQIRDDDLQHISYVVRMKVKTLDYVCNQIGASEMLEADKDVLKNYCTKVRQEYQTFEDRVEELLMLLKKPFERGRMSTIKSRVTQMLEEEKAAIGVSADWGLDAGCEMLSEELYCLFGIIQRSRAEISRLTEDLMASILGTVTQYERESSTWIEVFDDVSASDVLDG